MSVRLVHGIDLTAPGGIAALLDHHRSRWGTATMTAPTGGEGGSGGDSGAEGGEGGQGGAPGGDGGNGGGQGGAPTFTQADLDRILGERLAGERKKHADELKAAQELAGKNETEKLAIERDQANERATSAQKAASERVARSEVKGVARDMDARPDRLDAILRQVDLGECMTDGDVDDAKVKAAVTAVLASFPEWKKTTHAGSSGGELNGSGSEKPSFTRKQIEDMSDEERQKRLPEINEALAAGRVTG